MNMSRELEYNKKRGTFDSVCECLPLYFMVNTHSKLMSVYFFMTNTNKVRSDKISEML